MSQSPTGPTRVVPVRGLRLRVSMSPRTAEPPSETPLLLCNGLGASLELWEPFRAALRGWPHIAFDAPGTGASDVPLYPPTLRWTAGAVIDMLDILQVERVDLLGVSWGGALAQEISRRHPDRVRRLILAATSAGWLSVPGHPSALAVLATPIRYWSRSYFTRVAPTLYGGEIRDDPGLLERQQWLRFTHQVTARGYAWQLLAARRWTSLPWLHRLAQPTLVLAGGSDPIVPLVNARVLAARIPNARLHIVAGGSHLFLLTRPGELVPVVTSFLNGDNGVSES